MSGFKSNLRHLKSRVFMANGRHPYARGYGSYRQIQLQKYVCHDFPEGRLPEGWGLWLDERVVEYPWFFSRLSSSAGRLLDAGSVLNYEYILTHEKLRNKSISILTLAPEPESHTSRGISYIYGDVRETCFRDDYFDFIASISTLEHVGMNNTAFYTTDPSKNELAPEMYLRATAELHRILKVGGVLYITLPFGRAQNLGWLQIFDLDMVQRLIQVFRPSSCKDRYFRYTNSGWQISSPNDCRGALYFDRWKQPVSRTDLAAAEAVACLELVK